MNTCVFCEIIRGELPSKQVYADLDWVVFQTITPAAPAHVLIVPKKHLEWQADLVDDSALLGRVFVIAPQIADKLGVKESGFKLVVNCGRGAGQEIAHFHVHLIGSWKNQPPKHTLSEVEA